MYNDERKKKIQSSTDMCTILVRFVQLLKVAFSDKESVDAGKLQKLLSMCFCI